MCLSGGVLGDKMPRGVGLVNDFLRGSPDCPGCREAGRRAGTSMELSQNCFTKPTPQGILSVSTVRPKNAAQQQISPNFPKAEELNMNSGSEEMNSDHI